MPESEQYELASKESICAKGYYFKYKIKINFEIRIDIIEHDFVISSAEESSEVLMVFRKVETENHINGRKL